MISLFDFSQFGPPLLRGAVLTVIFVVSSGLIGSVIGILFGLAATSPSRIARWISAVYINFLRGQPPLIILLFAYFAVPLLFPAATFSRNFTAIAGLSIYAGAYLAEIVRGSIQAIPKGQSEAASALGMHYLTQSRYIILPQALKIAVPSAIGFLISLVKASALTSAIGAVELTRAGRTIASINLEPLSTFVVVAAMYFVLSWPISLLGQWAERRLSGAKRVRTPAKAATGSLQ